MPKFLKHRLFINKPGTNRSRPGLLALLVATALCCCLLFGSASSKAEPSATSGSTSQQPAAENPQSEKSQKDANLFDEGRRLLAQGERADAIRAFKKSLALSKEMGNKKLQAYNYDVLGVLYQEDGNLDDAREMFLKALLLNTVRGSKKALAMDYACLGVIYYDRGEHDQAEEMLLKALAFYEEVDNKEGVLNTIKHLMQIYEKLDKLDRDEKVYKNIWLPRIKKSGNKEALADLYRLLASLYLAREEPDQAADEAAKSLALYQEIGDTGKVEEMKHFVEKLMPQINENKFSEAAELNNRGSDFLKEGELDQAEEMYLKSLAIYQELGHSKNLDAVYKNLGLVAEGWGKLDQAEEMYQKSVSIYEKLGERKGLAIGYNHLGEVYQVRGDWDRAEEAYLKALALYQELGDRQEVAADYIELSLIYQTQGDLVRAEAMGENVLAYYQEMGNKEGLAVTYEYLGVLCARQMKWDLAEEMVKKGQALYRETGAASKAEYLEGILDSLQAVRKQEN